MLRYLLKSKIHQATVTDSNLNYVGSVTIDKNLMEKADFLENEKVSVLDITNGVRFDTYVIKGKRGSGEICLNGAAARLVQKGDKVIILSYGLYEKEEVKSHKPLIILVEDNENRIFRRLETKEFNGDPIENES